MAAWPKSGDWAGARLREAVPEEHAHPAVQLQLLLQAPPRLLLRQRRARLVAERLRAQEGVCTLGLGLLRQRRARLVAGRPRAQHGAWILGV